MSKVLKQYKIMKKIILLVLVIICASNLDAQQLIQNNVETKVDFKIKNLGIYVKGNFSEVVFTGKFNKEDLSQSSFTVKIKVNSLSTGNKKRDAHLFKEHYFDAETYKEIKFTSTKIEKISENNYNLTGELTIKKTTKTIVIPIEINENDDFVIVKSEFDLNRKDYEVGGDLWILGNIVKAQITYSAKKQNFEK